MNLHSMQPHQNELENNDIMPSQCGEDPYEREVFTLLQYYPRKLEIETLIITFIGYNSVIDNNDKCISTYPCIHWRRTR